MLPEELADLQQDGRFSDSRITADEHKRTLDNSTAQHPVQLGKAGVIADFLLIVQLTQRSGTGPLFDGSRSHCFLRAVFPNFLFHCIPFPASGAFSIPFDRFISALITDIQCFDFSRHDRTSHLYSAFQYTIFPIMRKRTLSFIFPDSSESHSIK